jgi:hypothetical protein
MTVETENFVKSYVKETIELKMHQNVPNKSKGVLGHFKNVMIDDSTTIHLPDTLVNDYPGNVSMGEKKAVAKIHAMYNLTKNNFSFLHMHSFSNNDQSLSDKVIPYLQKGDLCIRDLGFSILDVMSEFIKRGIYFISRKTYKTQVFNSVTGKEIDILKELNKNGYIDKEVIIGKSHQINARLVVTPVSLAQAQERKRRAKNDRDKRLNHSEKYYKLLGYNIFITNIPAEKCSSKAVQQLYKLRWRIEIIFKSWKSCFSIEKIIHSQCCNVVRVNCTIYLMLLYIYLFHVVWLHNCEKDKQNIKAKSELSILKMATFFRTHFTEILTVKSDKSLISQIRKHCNYGKRKDRVNALEFEYKLAA